jgi:hypothetical protein
MIWQCTLLIPGLQGQCQQYMMRVAQAKADLKALEEEEEEENGLDEAKKEAKEDEMIGQQKVYALLEQQ